MLWRHNAARRTRGDLVPQATPDALAASVPATDFGDPRDGGDLFLTLSPFGEPPVNPGLAPESPLP